MSVKEDYFVRLIHNNYAENMVIVNHYLHRHAPAMYSFGLIRKSDNSVMGCIIYGCPASRPLQESLCGKDEADNVIELTRLWIDDSVGKNGETFLIGNSLRLLREMKITQDIIVSFSDLGVGHIGTIYQASNFIFTGYSFPRKDVQFVDTNNHSKTICEKYGASIGELKKIFGDKVILKERSKKCRYVLFNCDRKRKKELLKKLRFPILPYPKTNEEIQKNKDNLKESFEIKGGLF